MMRRSPGERLRTAAERQDRLRDLNPLTRCHLNRVDACGENCCLILTVGRNCTHNHAAYVGQFFFARVPTPTVKSAIAGGSEFFSG
jgi:hypothetical protein